MNDSDLPPLIKNKIKIKIETVTDDDDDNDEESSPLESGKQFLDYDSDEENESDDESDNDSEIKPLSTKCIYNYGAGKNNPLPLHAETVIADPDIFYFYKARREPD